MRDYTEEIEKECIEYCVDNKLDTRLHYFINRNFKAGVTSKIATKIKLEALIDENKSMLEMIILHGTERETLPIKARINELENQLKTLK